MTEKEVNADVPASPPRAPGILESYLHKRRVGDIGDTDTGAAEAAFPHTFPSITKRPIGSLYAQTIEDALLKDMGRRYQLGHVIIVKPVEEAFIHGFELYTDGQPMRNADPERWAANMLLFQRDKCRILRTFKLSRQYGHSELLFGFEDKKDTWDKEVKKNVKWSYTQPVAEENETDLKVTESLPIEIESLTTTFGNETIENIHPSRFIHTMNPKLDEEDKEGESVLLPIANMLTTQIHADWAIGQSLWRGAGGLLALYAPKKTLTQAQKDDAMSAVTDHNARTVIYVPFGWNVKDIMKRSANIAVARTYRVIVQQIAAGSGIPESILLGIQPGGLGQDNNRDEKNWFRYVGTQQENTYGPFLDKYFRAAQIAGMTGEGEVTIVWNELESRSPLQKERDALESAAISELLERLQGPQYPEMPEVPEGMEGMPLPEMPQIPEQEEISTPDLLKLIAKKR